MTQIKIFANTTYQGSGAGPDAFTIEMLNQEVNAFLAENDGKIILKDIKYTVQSPNPREVFNLNVKVWTIMVIYETL